MSKPLKTLILWLILVIATCYLQTGCFSSSRLRLPFYKTNPPLTSAPNSSSHPTQTEASNNQHSSEVADSTSIDAIYEESENLSLSIFRVDSASFWVAQAEIDLSRGDTLAAEASLVIGISLLGETLVDLSPAERLIWMDSLATWAMRYSSLMGGEYVSLDPGAQGLAALPVEAFLDTTVVDSLMLELTIDSFEIEIDTTIDLMRPLPEIPDTMNSKVQSVIDYFTGTERGRKAIEIWFSRAGEIIPRMNPILRQHGMPEDLVYLAMIESGFRNDARSWAKAVGPWQFIHSTGKLFSLEANWWYDERRDTEKSTAAAARYLRQLYEHLGDWYLAIAGYNCGEGRIWRERRRSNSTDFWKLKRLPKQTRHYIPTFLAARRIAQNPEEYGFAPIQYIGPAPRDSIVVRDCADLTTLSEIIAVTVDTLQKMNPALIRWCTPPAMDSVIVYVPHGVAEGFEEKFAAIPDEKKTSWVHHKVRAGETLGLIAKKYRTTIRAILDVPANKIKNPHRISEGAYLLIPVVPKGVKAKISHLARHDFTAVPEFHIVQRGDSLTKIAKLYQVDLQDLKEWNSIKNVDRLNPGDKIRLKPLKES